jgi:transposase-like protein
MKASETEIFTQNSKIELEDCDQELEELNELERFSKLKTECICPGCGKMHLMKLRWIGRGIPRKFCQRCRDRDTPLDDEES